MKRTSKPRWRKQGGGTLTLRDGRTIQPREVFRANESDIPEAFRDVVERQSPSETSASETENEGTTGGENLEMVHVGGGWYNLINTQTGKPINAQKMRRKELEPLLGMSPEEAAEELEEE